MSELRIQNLMALNEAMTPRDYAVQQLSYIKDIERLREQVRELEETIEEWKHRQEILQRLSEGR